MIPKMWWKLGIFDERELKCKSVDDTKGLDSGLVAYDQISSQRSNRKFSFGISKVVNYCAGSLASGVSHTSSVSMQARGKLGKFVAET